MNDQAIPAAGYKTLEEVIAAIEVERRKPLNRIKRFCWYTPRRKVRDIRNEIRWARQRVTRGWDERAYWNTDSWLAKYLGAVLLYSADRLHGHPHGVDFEDWVEGYRKAGEALIEFSTESYEGTAGSQVIEDAQAALRWVADNLVHLWD